MTVLHVHRLANVWGHFLKKDSPAADDNDNSRDCVEWTCNIPCCAVLTWTTQHYKLTNVCKYFSLNSNHICIFCTMMVLHQGLLSLLLKCKWLQATVWSLVCTNRELQLFSLALQLLRRLKSAKGHSNYPRGGINPEYFVLWRLHIWDTASTKRVPCHKGNSFSVKR